MLSIAIFLMIQAFPYQASDFERHRDELKGGGLTV